MPDPTIFFRSPPVYLTSCSLLILNHSGLSVCKRLAAFTLLAGVVMMVSAIGAITSSPPSLQPDAVPFTMQEWWWALKGGYLDTMLAHYFRHGGLVVDSNPTELVLPFTLQEWWWSIQGGYLQDMVAEQFQNGGLLVGSTAARDALDTVSLTPQEWMWAAQGGYIDSLTEHVAQNGGLASGVDVSSTVAFTPQEWAWAVRGGYLNTMMEHFIRNGGL